ncbi:MAG: hypothetical protein EOO20_09535 [Chryseobacterium sp.]|nr:MAG: hypothetical protein EOO20_09535 [Chryseobacterium sp.]
MGAMSTLTEVLEKLKARGMDNELKLSDHGKLQGMGNIYSPQDLTIIKIFRFEGMSDPGDNSAIYLIRDKGGNTGYVMDSYGMYSDNHGAGFDEFLKQIPVAETQDWK